VLDLLITGGTVVDGTGVPARRADVAVRDGVVVDVGVGTGARGAAADGEPAARTIDATGLVVSPGFVDVHTHYDAQVMWDPACSPSSLHGVTTVLAGNCGFTIAPTAEGVPEYIANMLSRVEGIPIAALDAGLDWKWSSFGSYLDRLEGRLGVNAGFLAGHSTIRRCVMGEAAVGEEATPEQIAAMVALLRRSIDEGALGFSSTRASAHYDSDGQPVPSRWATVDELIALSGAVADSAGTAIEFIPTVEARFSAEVCDLMARMSLAARRPLNWNLLGVRPGEAEAGNRASKLAASDHAAALGGRVLALCLPDIMRQRLNLYTGFTYDLIPGWTEVMHLPYERKREALADPAVRDRMLAGAEASPHFTMSRLADSVIVDVASPQMAGSVGRSIGDIAAERRCRPIDALLDVALDDGLRTGIQPPNPDDSPEAWEERARLWRDPRVIIGGSDAGAHLDQMQTFNCHTAFLAKAVRDKQLIGLEEAIHLVTDVPARLYGLRGRGRIAPGWAADLVLFDLDRVGPAPVEVRHDLPGGAWRLTGGATGVERVLVNGVEIVDGGELTGDLPGTVIRSGRDTDPVSL
jgi:N-acyl-D-aspartate/D-glutamate deacylase